MTRTFIQTREFSRNWDHLGFDDEDLRVLEQDIMKNPEKYPVMKGTGGLRKARISLDENKGNGYLLSVDGNPHCIAYWDAARDVEFTGKAELICIHSLPDNWHKGYGSQMMDRVLKDIKEAGCSEVVLWVFRDNLRARAFYEANGFTLTDIKVATLLSLTALCLAACGSQNSAPVNLTDEAVEIHEDVEKDSTEIAEETEKIQ